MKIQSHYDCTLLLFFIFIFLFLLDFFLLKLPLNSIFFLKIISDSNQIFSQYIQAANIQKQRKKGQNIGKEL